MLVNSPKYPGLLLIQSDWANCRSRKTKLTCYQESSYFTNFTLDSSHFTNYTSTIADKQDSKLVRIISKSRLREFWESGNKDAEGPLKAWHTHVQNKTIAWENFADVKAAIGTASLVGNCVVFNIRANKYRLITRVLYRTKTVYILKVMTHEEYDENKWKEDCGCYAPPPKAKKKRIKKPLRITHRRHR